ncbi:MAG: recombinase family protein [Oscillospiraceae bacterium]|jgi:DNA invertase Pin-like site-specific DNA recombinase|nr:recombinase family protein [Oscillospiraceae bacterium]
MIIKDVAPITPLPKRQNVAAYARVSCGKDEMLHSLAAQVSAYSALIQSRPDWNYCGVFAEAAETGTKESRPEFQRLLTDCRAGLVDMVITKSISRFARNTVTLLATVRELKELGVDVFFEEQRIHSLSCEGKLMLTILAGYAQEESRSCSDNVKWRVRKDFEQGKPSGFRMMGYRLKGGIPTIVPKEAEWVRQIFADYLEGFGVEAIAKHCKAQGIKIGKTGIAGILRNVKYMGDMLLQKGFTTNYLTKARKKNEGEIPQFWVEGSHPAIISVDEWETVQAELARRSTLGRSLSCHSPFATRLVCGSCGGFYGKKVWGSYKDDKSRRREVWQCNDKYKRLGNPGKGCQTPTLTEDDIKARFLAVWNGMADNRENLISDCRTAKELLCNYKNITAEIAELEREVEVARELSRKAIYENAHTQQNQAEWNERNDGYLERVRTVLARITELTEEKRRRQHKARILESYIRNLEKSPDSLTDFDEKVFITAIDRMTVELGGTLTFLFLDGSSVVG